jgi:DNA-directed RNA polymerase beta subunit
MDYRIAGKSLLADNVEIKVFILVTNAHGIGDKLVLSHSLKSVVGDVVMEDMTTENGDDIDMIFSYRSVANRIVVSPIINGILGSLLEHYRKKVVTEFFA